MILSRAILMSIPNSSEVEGKARRAGIRETRGGSEGDGLHDGKCVLVVPPG